MKINIKKLVFSSVLALPLLFNPVVSASSSVDVTSENNNNNNYSEYAYPSPVPVIADGTGAGSYEYHKSVVKYYSSLQQIPERLYYEEYNNEKNVWMRGYLTRSRINQITLTRYEVFFYGQLRG